MKKLIILSIALLACGTLTFAQNSKSFYKTSYESRNSGSWDQASSIITFGIGFPNVAVGGYGSLSGFPPLYVKYEHGFLRDEVGLGGYVSTGWGSYDYYNTSTYKTNFAAFSVGILGYYHFNKLIPIEKMDVYAGAGFGFRSIGYKSDDNQYGRNDNDFNVLVLVKVGIRYYVKEKLSFYAESGYDGMSDINMGVTLKMN